jgi:hypothetical protein
MKPKEKRDIEDHDQRFKLMLREFFEDFLRLFLPKCAEFFEFSEINWLDKELFTDPPSGERRHADLVAELKSKSQEALPSSVGRGETLALIHVEIESADSVEEFRAGMFHYYEHLRVRYAKPVLPVALYLRVGLNGLGTDVYEESFLGKIILRFEYFYIGLPALDAEKYCLEQSPLAIALSSLMKCPRDRRVELLVLAFKRLLELELNDRQLWLLCDCLIAYSRMDEKQVEELRKIMTSEANKSTFPYVRTFFDDGLIEGRRLGHEEGRSEGRAEGRAEGQQLLLEMVESIISSRFGSLNEGSKNKLRSLSVEELRALCPLILKANNLSELGLE